MAATSSTTWTPENDIGARVAELTSQDSAMMRQAKTAGMQMANKRGVMNSTMGIGAAQGSAIAAATPIASQESQERTQTKLGIAQIAANERGSVMDAGVRTTASYNDAVASIMSNTKLSATARQAALASALGTYNQGLASIGQLYGVNVPAWSSGGTTSGIGSASILPTAPGL